MENETISSGKTSGKKRKEIENALCNWIVSAFYFISPEKENKTMMKRTKWKEKNKQVAEKKYIGHKLFYPNRSV